MFKTRYIAIFLGVMITAFLLYYFSQIVAYTLMAWVISMLGSPIMAFFLDKLNFKKLKFGRSVSAMLVLMLFVLLGIVGMAIFFPPLLEQASILTEIDYSTITSTLQDPLDAINDWLTKFGVSANNELKQQDIQELMQSWIRPDQIGNVLGSIIGLASDLLIGGLAVLFISFFFLKDTGLFTNFIKAVTPVGTEKDVERAIEDISYLLTRYFGGIVIQISIITLFVYSALSLLGIQNALLIGVFAACINVIPFVGPLIGALFAIFITMTANIDVPFYNELMPKLVNVVLIFGSMQLMDNFLIQPIVFSNRIKAHPLEIFLIILVGAQIGGILGMILAIPSYTVIRAVANVFFSNYKLVQKMNRNLESKK